MGRRSSGMQLTSAESDAGTRVIVSTGEGRGFCAGADMAVLSAVSKKEAQLEENPEIGGISMREFRARYAWFPTLSKPIIAAVNGPCAGLGFVIACYCDIRYASTAAMFTTSFARRGLIAEYGIAWILPKLIGQSASLDLLMSARKVGAAEALQIGLVSKVTEPDKLLDDALSVRQPDHAADVRA